MSANAIACCLEEDDPPPSPPRPPPHTLREQLSSPSQRSSICFDAIPRPLQYRRPVFIGILIARDPPPLSSGSSGRMQLILSLRFAEHLDGALRAWCKKASNQRLPGRGENPTMLRLGDTCMLLIVRHRCIIFRFGGSPHTRSKTRIFGVKTKAQPEQTTKPKT